MGGVRKTTLHEKTESNARPRKGAKMGVNKNMVKTNDMIRAISSPTNRSRTPAIVAMNTADAPMPAMNRATNINERVGERAAATPPIIYNGKPIRKIAIRPNRSDNVPKIICATCPMKKNPIICAGAVESAGRPK